MLGFAGHDGDACPQHHGIALEHPGRQPSGRLAAQLNCQPVAGFSIRHSLLQLEFRGLSGERRVIFGAIAGVQA